MKMAILILLSIWSVAGIFLYLSVFDSTNQAKPWKSVVNVIVSGPIMITITLLSLAIGVIAETWGWFSRKYRTWLSN